MIDIIIPVYNTPPNDLERCLNSIMNQTFKKYTVYKWGMWRHSAKVC